MSHRSRRFSLTESDSQAQTSFSSTPSWVLASRRSFFSCLTLVSTLSPAFSWRRTCCLSKFIPAPSAILSSYLHICRTLYDTYHLKHILPEGVSLGSPAAASAA